MRLYQTIQIETWIWPEFLNFNVKGRGMVPGWKRLKRHDVKFKMILDGILEQEKKKL